MSDSNTNEAYESACTKLMDRQTAINGFKNIEKISAQPGQDFCVVAYFLSEKIGSDGCHGLWYFLGTYSSAKKAKDKAIKLIEKTGIQTIYATKTCSWQEINDRHQSDRTKMVPIDKEGKLRQQHEKEQREIARKFEQEKQLRYEIQADILKEADPTSIEYYEQQWFRIVKSNAAIVKLQNEIDSFKKTYLESVENINEAYRANPSHEKNWIPHLEEKLTRRGESDLFEALKSGSQDLRSKILGLDLDSDSDY